MAALSVTGIDLTIWSRTWRDESQGGDVFLVSTCACQSISRYMLADVCGHGNEVAPIARRLRRLMAKHMNRPDQTMLARALNIEFADHLGFWKALPQVFPTTRGQRCWVHKTANVLDKLPRRLLRLAEPVGHGDQFLASIGRGAH